MINASLPAASSVASPRSVSLDSNPPMQNQERNQRYNQLIERFMSECSSADLKPILERAALFGRNTDPMEAFPMYLTREVRTVQGGELQGVMIFQDSVQGRCWFFSPFGVEAYDNVQAFSENQPWQLDLAARVNAYHNVQAFSEDQSWQSAIAAAAPGNPFDRLLDIPVRQPRGAVFIARDHSNLEGIEQQGWEAMLELMQTAQEIAGQAVNVLQEHRDNRAQALEQLSQSRACSNAIEHHRLEMEQLISLVREEYPQRFTDLDEAKHEQLESIDASNDIDYRFEVERLRRTADKQEVELLLEIVAERFGREVTHL
ncbi:MULTISPECIES: hypothetical protein [Pseudomonas]|uniref:Uncharacterized protein n=1 Tax=Pseudomonas fluorescens TaxID=294 RepID=A0A5E6SGF5_PSEFL|nr:MULTISPECIES: hypothetical protein [Pseudomonas]VVM79791.1 hypothetical protein PS652_02227 [Pseudomonas fluorescens]